MKPDTKKTDAVLLQPPPGDLTGPYPALAYLKAAAREKGYAVQARDLGIEALWYLSASDRLEKLLERAAVLRAGLEAKAWLSANEQRQYLLLVSALGLGLKPNLLHQVLALFQEKSRFYDYFQYQRTCRFLEAFYRLLSAVHHPTRVTPAEYPTIREFDSIEQVLAHRDRSRNPFVDYYEEVLLPQIVELEPAVVGVSMVFASQSVQALVLGKLVKERLPGVHVTLGGAYLSQWALLLDDERLEEIFTCCDSIVCGEGEDVFPELLGRVVTGQPLDGVPNLIHRDPLNGRIQRLASLEYPDLADLPAPDYSDFDFDAYLTPEPIIPYCISRGCYWGRCAFCQNRYGENRMRRYQAVPVEKALAEMAQLAEQHGSRHFNFSNDAIDPAYLRRFSEAAIRGGHEFIWNTDLRAEKVFTPELCQLLAQAGLNSVAIGFESGCQKTLDAMDKGYRVETLRAVFKNLYDAGVATQAMGIFGFPGETEEDGTETVRFLEENSDRLSYYVIGLLMVLPGSRLYDDPPRYGISSITYEGNPLRAPEPVWRSTARMPARAVGNLYNRLSQLEQLYAINDYPYVGGLSTNHSFLYFELGPDILKRLKHEENEWHRHVARLLWGDNGQITAKRLKLLVPRLTMPYVVYSAPYPLEEMALDPEGPRSSSRLLAAGGEDYLIDPINPPIRINPVQRKLVQRMDGQRNLKAILDKLDPQVDQDLFRFLAYLVSQGLVALTVAHDFR